MNLPSSSIANRKSKIENTVRAARFILHRRRRGKIAGLPQAVREQINLMLKDGLPYTTIIARLGHHGKDLIPQNLVRWRKADHQDWLAEQHWLAACSIRRKETPNPDPSAMRPTNSDSTALSQPAQAAKDLALLLTELDDNRPVSGHADHLSRHVNLAAKIVDIIYPTCSSRRKESANPD